MPDVDTFEQRLGDALRSDADTSVPRFDPAAIARVAVLADRTRGSGRVAARRNRRVPRRMWLLAAATLTVAGGLVAAGSGLLRPTAVNPSDAVPSQSVIAQVSPSTESVVPALTDDAAGPATAGMINNAGDILLASATVGWMSTSNAIYRTRDMGSTWTAVGPAGWSSFAHVQFVDADTAYATSKISGSDGAPLSIAGPMTIAATHDGGTSWVEATIDAPSGMANMGLSFRTPANGFVTFFTQDGTDVRVFETTDGGRTWASPVRSSAPRMLYLLKNLSGDPATGAHALVLTNSLAPGRPFDNNVYFSLDGGATWTKRAFPISGRAPARKMKGAGLWADGSGRIVLAMDVEGDEQVYTSDDDGQSWQFVRDLGPDVGHVQLMSAAEWVFASGSAVLSTEDGGATWRTTESGLRIYAYEVSFASPDRGWALLDCSSYPAEGLGAYCPDTKPGVIDGTHVFLRTTDGGRTWARIGQ